MDLGTFDPEIMELVLATYHQKLGIVSFLNLNVIRQKSQSKMMVAGRKNVQHSCS